MQLSEFNFNLPPELIANEPLAVRSASRMLVVERGLDLIQDRTFSEFPNLLRRDDLLVINNTRVFPARVFGRTQTGAKAEVFLVSEIDCHTWRVLARPGRRLRPGKLVEFDGELSAEVLERSEDGSFVIRFSETADLEAKIDTLGRTPLPPYIKRGPDSLDSDRERYQTVYAKNRGAIAAPTAGLHFTPELLAEVRDRGIETAEITLHVGYGTFEPVRSPDLDRHRVAAERFEIGAEASELLESARTDGRRIIAVGTTTTRTLEFVAGKYGAFPPSKGLADLTILPGYRFRAVNALLTNFHLPESSLLILVATFGGHQLIMRAYEHAVEARYRFYSYGDCMFIA
ncbi:MAG: tRNA preQ1(34) S-adenosylmethionine ribosyltransferase-isomerase QueA [Chloracidobacterium sp.]|nr:tRNA preQ1(34) S-adenosylmethionine ribosyltransferase-isomerase QueA [Chloracidobacterium sp.]